VILLCSLKNTEDPVASEIIQIVQKQSQQVFTSMGCAADTYARWEQTTRNFDNLHNSYKIKELFDKVEGKNIIVLGGGPSLKGFIEEASLRPELAKNSLIISCDATLPLLLKNGIRPHLVTRCERKLTTIFGKTKKSDTKDIFYVAYTWTPPEFFELFEESFVVFRDNGVNRWTEYDPGSINGGVSSANAAVELAFMLGKKNNIIMAGIDLVFIDNKTHVEGTEVEFDVEKSRPKWIDIECNDGETRTSIPVWQRCQTEYNQGIYKHIKRECKIYNTSALGGKCL